MALGLPIVASKIAPVQEVVEEDKNALLVEPGSSTALCQKISCLLNNWEQASSMGKRSRISFEERFTIEHSVKEMVELYRQIS
jgi:glycosyltransferase involved in cell wall biosynthesis